MRPDEDDAALLNLIDAPPVDLQRLRERLALAAAGEGVLDIAYRTIDTPVGKLLLAATERGLLRIGFEREGFDAVLEGLAERVSPRLLHEPRRLDGAALELEEYFEGRRDAFDLPLDLRLSRGFRQDVLARLRLVRYGATTTYAGLAAAAGRPRAVRAAASACATNPLSIVVPCHRVLRSDGGLGGYLGGLDVKRALLRLEAARSGAQ